MNEYDVVQLVRDVCISVLYSLGRQKEKVIEGAGRAATLEVNVTEPAINRACVDVSAWPSAG